MRALGGIEDSVKAMSDFDVRLSTNMRPKSGHVLFQITCTFKFDF
jgi:hypothetical protein